jgi:hypothetical protein
VDRGFVYVWPGATAQSAFIWDPALGWIWTGKGFHPWVYRYATASWVWTR